MAERVVGLPGTPMCRHMVAYDTSTGSILERPRPCSRAAALPSPFCRRHAMMAAKIPAMDVRDGGFCVCCAKPGRSYVDLASNTTIALCRDHGRALLRALREGR